MGLRKLHDLALVREFRGAGDKSNSNVLNNNKRALGIGYGNLL